MKKTSPGIARRGLKLQGIATPYQIGRLKVVIQSQSNSTRLTRRNPVAPDLVRPLVGYPD